MVATSGSESSSLNKVPVLVDEDGFKMWQGDCESFLRSKKLWKYVAGTAVKPVMPENPTRAEAKRITKEIEDFEGELSTVWFCFRQALTEKYISILDLVPSQDVKQAWDAISARFGVSNTLPNQLELLDQFNNIEMTDDGKKSLVDRFNNVAADIEITYSRLLEYGMKMPVEIKLGRLISAVKSIADLDSFCQTNLVHQVGIDYATGRQRLLDRVLQLDKDRQKTQSSAPSGKPKKDSGHVESVANLVKTVNRLTKQFKQFSKFKGDPKKKGGKNSGGADKKDKKSKKGKKFEESRICYNCKKPGHIAANCTEPKQDSSNAVFVGDNQKVLDDFEFLDLNDSHNVFHTGLSDVPVDEIVAMLADDDADFQRCYACSDRSNSESTSDSDGLFDLSEAVVSVAAVTHTPDVNLTNSAKVMIMDSGSNRTHVTEKTVLSDYQDRSSSVTVANGEHVCTHGVGMIGALEASHTDLSSNLLSIGQLADAGYETTFTKTHALVIDEKTKRVVCRGKRVPQGLYFIGTDKIAGLPVAAESVAMVASTNPVKGVNTWHSRTHLSDKTIASANRIVDGLNLKKADFYRNPSLCSTCATCKMTRRAFKKASHRPIPSELFRVVSSDLSGKISPVGYGGVNYIILFVDERSRFKHMYFLKTKDEALEKFKVFKSQGVEAYGFKMTEVFTDGGGEYEGEFHDFCVANAIVHTSTSPHTPEENSTVEVYWRTLMGMVRSFLKTSVLPKSMWPYAAKHANYILNRFLPVTIGTVTKTAYQWRFNMRPNLKHLRVWGCEVVYKVHGHVKKLADRGREGYYIGVDTNSRSAVILDKETKKIVKSGHVVFNEIIEKRMEVDSQETRQNIKAVSLQRGHGAETVTEEVHGFDFEDLDLDDDGLFRCSSDFSFNDEDDSGFIADESRYYDQEPDAEYWPTAKRAKTDDANMVVKESTSADGLFTPSTYSEAVECDEGAQWKLSIDEELSALESNFTWSVVRLPNRCKALKSKWVFKIKKDEQNRPVRKKSRLTIKGFIQRHGIDYWETFSPVAKLISLRLFFAIAAQFHLNLFQMDVNNAFLNAELKEDIYMEVPEGFDLDGYLSALPEDHELRKLDRKMIVLKLNKSLYGLKQAPREWYLHVSAFLKSIGYEQLAGDACLFVRRRDGKFSMIALYVDDLIIASSCPDDMKSDVKLFNEKYKMKNIGKPELIVGLNVTRDVAKGTIKLSQQKYVHELLQRFRMENAATASTSADYNVKLTKDMCPSSDADKKKMAKYPYRELIGCLMYLSVGTRPDISFAVSELSKYLSNPGMSHWTAALHVLRYLKGTPDLGITYFRSSSPVELKAFCDFDYKGPSVRSLKLEAYADADWGGDKDTRRSHTGGVLFLAGGAIAWISKKQTSVAMSSAEAEYMSASLICREVIWIRSLLAGLGFVQRGPTVIHEDNAACIQMSKNPVQHSKTKHIDLHYHFVRERVETGEVRLDWISTERMIADMLTKALIPKLFLFLRELLFNEKKDVPSPLTA